MKKRVVLSANENPDYWFYFPVVEWIWNKYGWHVDLFVTDESKIDFIEHTKLSSKDTSVYIIPSIEGVRTGTLAQVVRHFASNVLPKEDYIMVQDIDLLPLRPWEPDTTKKTIYGWELTGRSFIPVHYTGMMGHDWYDIMGCTGDLKADMEREMKANGRAYGAKWEEYWDADWDILTQKVLARKNEFTFVPRGMMSIGHCATAEGRVDRVSIKVNNETGAYSWGWTLNQPERIDMHCENNNSASPEKWKMIRDELIKHHPDLPEWVDGYVREHHRAHGK